MQKRHLALVLLSLCKLSPLLSLTYWAGLRKTQGSTHKLQCWGLLWRLAKISTQNCRRHTYTNSLACELYQPHPTLNTAILNFVFLVTWIIFVWGTTTACTMAQSVIVLALCVVSALSGRGECSVHGNYCQTRCETHSPQHVPSAARDHYLPYR